MQFLLKEIDLPYPRITLDGRGYVAFSWQLAGGGSVALLFLPSREVVFSAGGDMASRYPTGERGISQLSSLRDEWGLIEDWLTV